MEINKLTGSQLFIAGSIITRISEELKKAEMDTDTEKATKYLLKCFDNIEKEIAGEVLIRIKEGMDQIKKQIEES